MTKLKNTKKKKDPILDEDCSDSNGCNCFSICKKINIDGVINNTCYNPKYFIDKLGRECKQLVKKE